MNKNIIKVNFIKRYKMKHSALLIVAFLASQANAAGYPGCGNSSSCFGSEGECLNLGNCNMMISYQVSITPDFY